MLQAYTNLRMEIIEQIDGHTTDSIFRDIWIAIPF